MAKLASRVKTKSTKSANNQNVEYIHPALNNLLPQYMLIRDVIEGSAAVKKEREKYLPKPNAHDMSIENEERYNSYISRAVFYGVTRRTQAGLVGQVMLVDPVIEVPQALDPVIKDINGSGVSAIQLAEMAVRFNIAYGRAGVLADYPQRIDGKEITVADQKAGRVRPTVSLYAPWDIINWRTALVGSERRLTLVVLKETYVEADDGFEQEEQIQYRVLRLVNGIYTVELWRKNVKSAGYAPVGPAILPTDGQGNYLDEIPFMFIGAMNNDSIPDDPPMFDMADLNIAHYRNSADYEESVFIVGQPTPYATGLTERWMKDVLGGKLDFGSRGGIGLPENATIGLVQMQPNAAAFEAMQHKERQMIALGAKLVEQKNVQRTATETAADEAAEASTLTTVTKNVSVAFKWVLEWCAIFDGVMTISEDAKSNKIKFELNTKFDFSSMTAEEVRIAIEAWQKDAITFSEMREFARRAGYATLDNDMAKAEIEEMTPSGERELDPDNTGDNDDDE